MADDIEDQYITYVNPIDEGPKLTRHQAFYQRNSDRLKKESRERWHRGRKKFETLSKAEKEAVRERRRQISAAYREKNRTELREKEKHRRQQRKSRMEHSEKL